MSSNYINLDINQGESYCITLNASDSNGDALNLSGYNARSYIKSYYSQTGYLEFTPLIVSITGGIMNFSLTSYETESLPVGKSVYDIELYQTGISGLDTEVTKLAKGYINVYPQATI
jgi:hypothetical protein